MEARVGEKLPKEFSRTESRILGALSKLDDSHLNPQVRICSVAVPGRSKNNDSENREPTGDRSLDDLGPEVVFLYHRSGNLIGSELEESHHMVTGVQEEVPYCSLRTSSGKQKTARSTSQPKFRSENTSLTVEADHILLTLQQLAKNSISDNFNNNINRISIFPKSFTTTMPTLTKNQRNSNYLKISSKQI